jgi:hypothetical protein
MNSETIVIEKPIEHIDRWEFTVCVGSVEFKVEVEKSYWRKLTSESISARELVFRSFLFLLEREPKEGILSSFNIRDISTYFSEYEQKIQEGLQS